MSSMLQVENVFVDVSTANAAMDFHLHEVTKGETDTLSLLRQFTSWRQNEHLWLSEGEVDSLQGTKSEDASFTRTTLTLHDDVTAPNDGQDSTLLHRRGLIESVGVETYE